MRFEIAGQNEDQILVKLSKRDDRVVLELSTSGTTDSDFWDIASIVEKKGKIMLRLSSSIKDSLIATTASGYIKLAEDED